MHLCPNRAHVWRGPKSYVPEPAIATRTRAGFRRNSPGVLRNLMKRFTRVLAVLLIGALLPAVASTDKAAKSLYEKGRAAEVRQDYIAAYNFYHQAYQLKPSDLRYRASFEYVRFLASASYVHQGEILVKAGKLQEGLTNFEQATAIDPSSFIAQQQANKTRLLIQKSLSPAPAPTAESGLTKRMEEAAGPVELAPIAQTPITLKLTEDGKTVYGTIGKLAGVNVLFDPDYTSKRIRVDLNGVTLEEALEITALESKTFWRPVTPNTIFVAADTPAKRKELEQSVIRTFYLTNLSQPNELQDLVNILRTLLDTQRLQQFPSQQAIVVRGTPDQIAMAEKLIHDIDKGQPEVVVEVAIMQVTRSKMRNLGIQPPGSVTVQLQDNNTTTSSTTVNGNAGNGGTATTTSGNTGGINLNSLAHLNATNFQVTIPSATANFLMSDSSSKLIQQPQIRAADGQKASLKIGERVPVATGSFQPGIGGVGINPLVNTQFNYIDVGVNVDITPRVHGLDEVTLKVAMDISAIDRYQDIGGISQPVIGQRKIEQEIRLREGEVNIMGGILENTQTKSLSGIPGLASIPLFKYLFAEEKKEVSDNEIIFILIPHIVRAQDLNDSNVNCLDVAIVQILGAHNVRNQDENDFVVADLFFLLGEEILEKRNGRQPWNSRQRLGLSVFKDTAHDVNFAFPQANLLFDLALPDHRLRNAADVLVSVNRRDIHGDFQGHLVEPVHTRCNVDVHANVNVVELSVDQRVDADSTDAGLERTGGHGYTLADLQ